MLRFRCRGLGFKIQGSDFRTQGLGVEVSGLRRLKFFGRVGRLVKCCWDGSYDEQQESSGLCMLM